jgi:hypothetical protein
MIWPAQKLPLHSKQAASQSRGQNTFLSARQILHRPPANFLSTARAIFDSFLVRPLKSIFNFSMPEKINILHTQLPFYKVAYVSISALDILGNIFYQSQTYHDIKGTKCF